MLFISCSTKKSNLTTSPLVTDHMVLQRDTTITIWGWAEPGSKISVSAEWGETSSTKTDNTGKWSSELKTSQAGGPYSLTIESSDTAIFINDVMLGEVWLASGQSNMSMPLKGWPPNDLINNSENEISQSDNPAVRMFTVERNLSEVPLSEVEGSWKVSSPSTSGDFSATAYFFARELQQKLNVPIGIIHTSWGGTPAESWTSAPVLSDLPDFAGVIEQLEKDRPQREALTTWFESLKQTNITPGDPDESWKSISFDDEQFKNSGFSDENWKVMNLPLNWEQTEMSSFDGVVWFRKTITLTELHQGATLRLGAIDDRDQTYVNGTLVGEHMGAGDYQIEREYEIPDGVLKKGDNVIAVRVIDTGGGGGIWKAEKGLSISTTSGNDVDLAGPWKYKPIAEYRGGVMYEFSDSDLSNRPLINTSLNSHTPASLFNAMINPLVPFTIKGAIWYQGESNVGRAEQYNTLFPSMIKDWRAQWGKDFSFYFVQIAPFNYGGNGYRSAELRESQRKSDELINTGMAITLDIGINDNIHPGNKQDVGKRLANLALTRDYDMEVELSPQLVGFEINGNEIRIQFSNVGEGLKLIEGDYFELSEDGVNYKRAEASVSSDMVILTAQEVSEVQSARYAWSDTTKAILFNSYGLPASSFKVER